MWVQQTDNLQDIYTTQNHSRLLVLDYLDDKRDLFSQHKKISRRSVLLDMDKPYELNQDPSSLIYIILYC